MSKRANPALVGGFILAGLALAVAGIIIFGGSRFWVETDRFQIYFQGSVNGLQVGSPVKLMGVKIGQVLDIHAVSDIGETYRTYTVTTVEIDRSRYERHYETPIEHGNEAISRAELQWLWEQGMRARLELQSLLTGQLYVSLQMLPDTPVRLVGVAGARYPEIPAAPTREQVLEQTVERVLERIQKLPLERIIQNIDSTVSHIDSLVSDPELRANTLSMLAQAHETLEAVEKSIEPGSALNYQVAATLRELQDAARSLRVLADYLEQYPNAVVFGRPGGGD